MIYRINYANSTFAKDKVIIFMDLDLTHMGELQTTYKDSRKVLYGENGVIENFNHTDNDKEYGDTYDTSTFGNLSQLITSSAQKISLVLKDVMFHSATGNSTTTENDTETRTTTEGSIEGTLVGYMKADVGHNRVKGNVSYVWGAMQEADGKDVNATGDHENHVMLSVSLTETTPKNIPSTPDTPSTQDTPVHRVHRIHQARRARWKLRPLRKNRVHRVSRSLQLPTKKRLRPRMSSQRARCPKVP